MRVLVTLRAVDPYKVARFLEANQERIAAVVKHMHARSVAPMRLPRGGTVYHLPERAYHVALARLADWWTLAERSTLRAEDVAFWARRTPSRSYVAQLRGEN